jgi:hypothetical protein
MTEEEILERVQRIKTTIDRDAVHELSLGEMQEILSRVTEALDHLKAAISFQLSQRQQQKAKQERQDHAFDALIAAHRKAQGGEG